jgi:hypothetical protein
MDEMALRELLASAVAAEPPMGPVATAAGPATSCGAAG